MLTLMSMYGNFGKRAKVWIKKSTAFLLAFLFVFANVSPAFSLHAEAANESDENVSQDSTAQEGAFFDSESSSDSATATEEPNIIDLSAPDANEKTNSNNSDKTKDKKDKNPEEDPAISTAETSTDPVNDNGASNYNNSKKQDNLPKTDIASGALVYSYPIITPPGRNGMEPNLNLNYNSQRKENQNLIGYGWEIDIPYIERINKNGTEKLYNQNYFN